MSPDPSICTHLIEYYTRNSVEGDININYSGKVNQQLKVCSNNKITVLIAPYRMMLFCRVL